MKKTINQRIRERREELDMSQDELAKKMGYKSRSTINKIELGINDITQSKIIAFAKALHTTPAYLMGWEEEQKNNDILADIVIELRANTAFRELVETIYNLEKANPEKLSAISAVIAAVKGF